MTVKRYRLPSRRDTETTTVSFLRADGSETHFEAGVGFDETGNPREIFLCGARTGSDMDALLTDAAVAISVALQHRVKASAMVLSISRIPEVLDGPATRPASIIGAALELLATYEKKDS